MCCFYDDVVSINIQLALSCCAVLLNTYGALNIKTNTDSVWHHKEFWRLLCAVDIWQRKQKQPLKAHTRKTRHVNFYTFPFKVFNPIWMMAQTCWGILRVDSDRLTDGQTIGGSCLAFYVSGVISSMQGNKVQPLSWAGDIKAEKKAGLSFSSEQPPCVSNGSSLRMSQCLVVRPLDCMLYCVWICWRASGDMATDVYTLFFVTVVNIVHISHRQWCQVLSVY